MGEGRGGGGASGFSDLLTSVARSVRRSSRAAMAIGSSTAASLKPCSSSLSLLLLYQVVTNLKARLLGQVAMRAELSSPDSREMDGMGEFRAGGAAGVGRGWLAAAGAGAGAGASSERGGGAGRCGRRRRK